MLKRILIIISLFSASISFAETDNIQLLKDFYDKNQSISSMFKQISHDAQGKLVQSSSGKMAIKRPGLFRWDYKEPFEQLIIADGKNLWVYDMDLDQVSVRNQKEVFGSTPSSVLMKGFKVIEEQFDIKDLGEKEGNQLISLLPKKSDNEYKEINIDFKDGQIVRMEVKDKYGQKTVFWFAKIINNPEFAADFFTFSVPEGVDVIGEITK